MPCYSPVKGFISYKGEKRKFIPVNPENPDYSGNPKMEVPCGQCYGCKLERSRQWAIRIIKEQKEWKDNSFITLTYDPENLPENGSLNKIHFKNFIKRLRHHFSEQRENPETNRLKRYYKTIRYFHCGEYGDKNKRPHYHAILFNVNFKDKKLWKRTKSGELLYRSKTLENLWPHGSSSIGNVTFESAAYVARYVMKKITGTKADEHYKIITNFSQTTGEILATEQLVPEYVTMSRRPGIGHLHYEKYKSDMFPSDEISVLRNGETKHSNVPRYYTNKLKIDNPEMHKKLKEKRILHSQIQLEKGEYTKIRLQTKLNVILSRTKNLHRHFEEHHNGQH